MFIVKNIGCQCGVSFATFAKIMLMKVLKMTQHWIDLCFDACKLPSIKCIKPKDRGNEETKRNFSFGSRQKVSDNIHLLQMSEFKTEFVKFLMKEYDGHAYLHILAYKIFYCSSTGLK